MVVEVVGSIVRRDVVGQFAVASVDAVIEDDIAAVAIVDHVER